jgi:hypothetical protein
MPMPKLFAPSMLPGTPAGVLTIALPLLAQFVLFVRWLYRRIRNEEMNRVFVEDMATNHLPHIYALLAKICDQLGIERAPLPPIRWVDLDERRQRRR